MLQYKIILIWWISLTNGLFTEAVLCRKGVLRNFAKIHRKTLVPESLFSLLHNTMFTSTIVIRSGSCPFLMSMHLQWILEWMNEWYYSRILSWHFCLWLITNYKRKLIKQDYPKVFLARTTQGSSYQRCSIK